MKYSISLVICTRNRAKKLNECLISVRNSLIPEDFELIIVDNCSSDDTGSVVNDFASSVNFPVKLIYAPYPGLGFARNAGLEASCGDIVAFTDDDCYVDRFFAYEVLAAFECNPHLGYVGGRVMLYDKTDLRVTIKESMERIVFLPGTFVKTGALVGANLAFRRKALEQAGGFDTLLGAGTPLCSGEDAEMICRLSSLGWSGLYAPEIVVFHHHGRKSVSELFKLNHGYDVGRGAFYASMVLKNHMRKKTLSHWISSIFHQKLIRSMLEMKGFLIYLYYFASNMIRQ